MRPNVLLWWGKSFPDILLSPYGKFCVWICLQMSGSASGRGKVVREQEKRHYKRNSPSFPVASPPLSGELLELNPSGAPRVITGMDILFPRRCCFRKTLCCFLSSPCDDASRHNAVSSPAHDHSSIPVHTKSWDRSWFYCFFHIQFHFTLAHERVTRFKICSLCQTACELQPAFWRGLGQYNVFVVQEFSRWLSYFTQGCCKWRFLNFTSLSKQVFRCLIRKQTI